MDLKYVSFLFQNDFNKAVTDFISDEMKYQLLRNRTNESES